MSRKARILPLSLVPLFLLGLTLSRPLLAGHKTTTEDAPTEAAGEEEGSSGTTIGSVSGTVTGSSGSTVGTGTSGTTVTGTSSGATTGKPDSTADEKEDQSEPKDPREILAKKVAGMKEASDRRKEYEKLDFKGLLDLYGRLPKPKPKEEESAARKEVDTLIKSKVVEEWKKLDRKKPDWRTAWHRMVGELSPEQREFLAKALQEELEKAKTALEGNHSPLKDYADDSLRGRMENRETPRVKDVKAQLRRNEQEIKEAEEKYRSLWTFWSGRQEEAKDKLQALREQRRTLEGQLREARLASLSPEDQSRVRALVEEKHARELDLARLREARIPPTLFDKYVAPEVEERLAREKFLYVGGAQPTGRGTDRLMERMVHDLPASMKEAQWADFLERQRSPEDTKVARDTVRDGIGAMAQAHSKALTATPEETSRQEALKRGVPQAALDEMYGRLLQEAKKHYPFLTEAQLKEHLQLSLGPPAGPGQPLQARLVLKNPDGGFDKLISGGLGAEFRKSTEKAEEELVGMYAAASGRSHQWVRENMELAIKMRPEGPIYQLQFRSTSQVPALQDEQAVVAGSHTLAPIMEIEKVYRDPKSWSPGNASARMTWDRAFKDTPVTDRERLGATYRAYGSTFDDNQIWIPLFAAAGARLLAGGLTMTVGRTAATTALRTAVFNGTMGTGFYLAETTARYLDNDPSARVTWQGAVGSFGGGVVLGPFFRFKPVLGAVALYAGSQAYEEASEGHFWTAGFQGLTALITGAPVVKALAGKVRFGSKGTGVEGPPTGTREIPVPEAPIESARGAGAPGSAAPELSLPTEPFAPSGGPPETLAMTEPAALEPPVSDAGGPTEPGPRSRPTRNPRGPLDPPPAAESPTELARTGPKGKPRPPDEVPRVAEAEPTVRDPAREPEARSGKPEAESAPRKRDAERAPERPEVERGTERPEVERADVKDRPGEGKPEEVAPETPERPSRWQRAREALARSRIGRTWKWITQGFTHPSVGAIPGGLLGGRAGEALAHSGEVPHGPDPLPGPGEGLAPLNGNIPSGKAPGAQPFEKAGKGPGKPDKPSGPEKPGGPVKPDSPEGMAQDEPKGPPSPPSKEGPDKKQPPGGDEGDKGDQGDERLTGGPPFGGFPGGGGGGTGGSGGGNGNGYAVGVNFNSLSSGLNFGQGTPGRYVGYAGGGQGSSQAPADATSPLSINVYRYDRYQPNFAESAPGRAGQMDRPDLARQRLSMSVRGGPGPRSLLRGVKAPDKSSPLRAAGGVQATRGVASLPEPMPKSAKQRSERLLRAGAGLD